MRSTNHMNKPGSHYLLYFGVFTAIGLLSHLLMVSFTNYTPERLSAITSIQIYALVITAFNIAGFIMLWMNEWIDKHQLLFSTHLLIVWIIELIVMGLLLLNRSTQRALVMQQEAAQLKDAYNQARYESLQSQLNPHFLFNNLNTLLSEIAHNRDSAMEFYTPP